MGSTQRPRGAVFMPGNQSPMAWVQTPPSAHGGLEPVAPSPTVLSCHTGRSVIEPSLTPRRAGRGSCERPRSKAPCEMNGPGVSQRWVLVESVPANGTWTWPFYSAWKETECVRAYWGRPPGSAAVPAPPCPPELALPRRGHRRPLPLPAQHLLSSAQGSEPSPPLVSYPKF